MREVYVVNCCRTAVGSFGGSLKDVPAVELGAVTVKEALNRAGIAPENVDEVMFGCILSAGLGQNPARQVALKAGLPIEVPAYTVSMVCGSGMKSVIEAGRAIAAGDAEIIVAGGTENMSSAPYTVPAARWGARMGNNKIVDTMVNDGLWDAYNNYHMGTTAENICEQYGLTREELDQFAVNSQNKTEAALAAGKFEAEIVPVMIKKKKELVEFKVDEYPKAGVTMESVSKLKGAFGSTGNQTTRNEIGILLFLRHSHQAAHGALVDQLPRQALAKLRNGQILLPQNLTGKAEAGIAPGQRQPDAQHAGQGVKMVVDQAAGRIIRQSQQTFQAGSPVPGNLHPIGPHQNVPIRGAEPPGALADQATVKRRVLDVPGEGIPPFQTGVQGDGHMIVRIPGHIPDHPGNAGLGLGHQNIQLPLLHHGISSFSNLRLSVT